MKKVNLLLGNSEELVNDLIEATVQEVCAGRAEVQCVRTAQMEDFVQQGSKTAFDLVIFVPNNLIQGPDQAPSASPVGKGVQAIQALKSHSAAPVIALPVFEARRAEEPPILQAGADRVLELPFDRNELKVAVSGLLKLPAQSHPPVGYRALEPRPTGHALRRAGAGSFSTTSPEVVRP